MTNYKTFEKICEQCSKDFIVRRSYVRFCSSSCAAKYGNKLRYGLKLEYSYSPVPCEKCAITPETKYSSGRFCSSKCARSFSTASRRKEISQKVSDTLRTKNTLRIKNKKEKVYITKICSCCNSEFVILANIKNQKKYCSKPCASKVVNSNPEKRAKASQRMIERNINGNFIQSFGRRVTYDKNGVNIRCDSLIEWCALEDLFQSHGVNGIKSIERSSARIPYEKDGIQHAYNPDFEARLSNGTHLIIECKSEQHGKSDTWKRYHADSILKRPLLENYCVMVGAVPVWFTQKTRKDLYAMIQKLSQHPPAAL